MKKKISKQLYRSRFIREHLIKNIMRAVKNINIKLLEFTLEVFYS